MFGGQEDLGPRIPEKYDLHKSPVDQTVKMADVIGVPNGYSFVREISSGGFGSVVELMDNSTQKHYAGKMIPCMARKDKERIDREVNRLRKFAHPGIVGLKELTSMDNVKVIVMELGEQSLADMVRDHTSRGILVAREVVYRVMVDVSSALKLMHNDSSGATAHGDVKMENILLFGGGQFKLCDLGAAESEDVSSTRSVMSQLYVSPERMESETGRATCSSDVWALGIVLHWLLFGEPPFKNQSLLKLGQEISLFQVSMIGSSCGGEERALLMRMLDPNPETRVTSCQLCSFGVFRCLVNTPSGVWRLKDADDKERHSKNETLKNQLEMEKNAHKQTAHLLKNTETELHLKEEELKIAERELKMERATHNRTLIHQTQDREAIKRLEMELRKEKERTAHLEIEMEKLRANVKNELEMEKNTRKRVEETRIRIEAELKTEQETNYSLTEEMEAQNETILRLERELAELRSNQTQPPLQPAHHSSGVRSNGNLASSAPRQGTVIRSQIGAAAIELFDRKNWTVFGDVFKKIQGSHTSLVSFEFGAVVARLSLTIGKGPTSAFVIEIISSNLSYNAFDGFFPVLKGGAGWNLDPDERYAIQNDQDTNKGSACLGGRNGQRVVLEADGREGKRTLKLSQDGETAPVFFTNIPVPFCFAVFILQLYDSVLIESVDVVSVPQMAGGTIPVQMDE
ncbi:putative CAMK family protein kinase [Blattamonas nauphoetae]|uniref:CAMK family protein kinase n=1 Tax=Blattamonas nauphoetae TaxID=2049346 RepID=A0ABQ9X5C1_9EUKA|nr:putative CAMK family protein kinase [Blattamonas nauphoetae]